MPGEAKEDEKTYCVYILSCADHFFETPVESIEAYAEAARECVYS